MQDVSHKHQDTKLVEREFVMKNTFIDWSMSKHSTALLRRVASEPVLPFPCCLANFPESFSCHRSRETTKHPVCAPDKCVDAVPDDASLASTTDDEFENASSSDAAKMRIDTHAYETVRKESSCRVAEVYVHTPWAWPEYAQQESSCQATEVQIDNPVAWSKHAHLAPLSKALAEYAAACNALKKREPIEVKKAPTVGAVWDRCHKRLEPASKPFCLDRA